MDWNNTVEDEENVTLAIIKLPAKVPITDPRYGGAVFMNPGAIRKKVPKIRSELIVFLGGPGGSGVTGMLTKCRDIQMSVDSLISPELDQVRRNKSLPKASDVSDKHTGSQNNNCICISNVL